MFGMAKEFLPGLDIKKLLPKNKEDNTEMCEVNIKGPESLILKMFCLVESELTIPEYID